MNIKQLNYLLTNKSIYEYSIVKFKKYSITQMCNCFSPTEKVVNSYKPETGAALRHFLVESHPASPSKQKKYWIV